MSSVNAALHDVLMWALSMYRDVFVAKVPMTVDQWHCLEEISSIMYEAREYPENDQDLYCGLIFDVRGQGSLEAVTDSVCIVGTHYPTITSLIRNLTDPDLGWASPETVATVSGWADYIVQEAIKNQEEEDAWCHFLERVRSDLLRAVSYNRSYEPYASPLIDCINSLDKGA